MSDQRAGHEPNGEAMIDAWFNVETAHLPEPVYVTCGTEGCRFCPCPVLPENADNGYPCAETGKPMARVR